jgi:hypothetical protein
MVAFWTIRSVRFTSRSLIFRLERAGKKHWTVVIHSSSHQVHNTPTRRGRKGLVLDDSVDDVSCLFVSLPVHGL